MANWQIMDFELNNNQAFIQMLAEIDPQLWRIKSKLVERHINSDFIPIIIEMISNVYQTTGQGVVEIVINKGKVEYVKGHTNVKIDMTVE